MGARFAWYTAVAAIVIGHVAAVYLAHVRAIGLFDAPGAALRSQLPLTALMVVYTFFGLSIAAQPIVESRAPPAAVASEVIRVPPGALLPRAQDGRLAEPGPDKTTARVKLVYKVLGSAYHDATRTSVADLLYAYAFAYRWGARDAPDDPHYDPVIEAATAPLRRHLVAVRAAGADAASKSFLVGDVKFVREVFTFEVYLNVAPADPDWNAVVAPPWSTLPWHVLALMEEAVSRGWAAFSEAEAKRRGVPWLDLVRPQELKARLAALVTEFEREAFRPPALRAHVSDEEARRRWRALAAFHAASGHFLVTNGPYKLKAWSPNERHPGGVSRPQLSAGRRLLRRLCRPAARLRHQGGTQRRASHRVRRYRGRGEVPAQPSPGAHAPEVRSRRAAAAGGAGVPVRDRRCSRGGLPSPARRRSAPTATSRSISKTACRREAIRLSALIAVNGNTMNADIHRAPLPVPAQR